MSFPRQSEAAIRCTNDHLTLLVRDIRDDFIIGNAIGQGGLGTVYEAVEKGTWRRFAVKRMTIKADAARSESAKARDSIKRKGMALREGEALNVVHGLPGVVGLRGWYQGECDIDLVMDLGEGGSLRRQVKAAGGRMNKEDAKFVLRQVFEGLSAVHGRQIIHADIKPDNIICRGPLVVGESIPEVFITDFGSARVGIADHVRRGGVTKFYAAPELSQPKVPYTCAVDAFACGIMLTELVTGKMPFDWKPFDDEETAASKFIMHQHDPFGSIVKEWGPEPLSCACLALASNLVMKSRSLRTSCTKALKHVWFQSIGGRRDLTFQGASCVSQSHPNATITTIPLSDESNSSSLGASFDGTFTKEEEVWSNEASSPKFGGGEELVLGEEKWSGEQSVFEPNNDRAHQRESLEWEGAPCVEAGLLPLGEGDCGEDDWDIMGGDLLPRDEEGAHTENEGRCRQEEGLTFFGLEEGGEGLGEALEWEGGELEPSTEESGVLRLQADDCSVGERETTGDDPLDDAHEEMEDEKSFPSSVTPNGFEREEMAFPLPHDSGKKTSPMHKLSQWLAAVLGKERRETETEAQTKVGLGMRLKWEMEWHNEVRLGHEDGKV